MKRVLMVLVALGLLFVVGCLTVPESNNPANSESEVILHNEPPKNVTWISPGKVQVGNFYPGARAEWDLLVHNGNDTATSFAVTYRYPDHVGEGYSMPAEEVQNWIIVADTTPILAPEGTEEILVVLDMPKDTDGWAIPIWNLSELGTDTRDELRVAYQKAVEEAAEEGNKDLPEKPELLLFLDGIYGVIVGSVEVNSEYLDYVIPTSEGKWEFWISVRDTSQTGMVQTELCCRWLITMRP